MSTRINKPNKATPVSADEFIIYDSQDTTDDKNITLGQIATFTENQNSTVTGTKVFADGVEFQKGNISFGQYSPLPTGIGSYIAQYTHPTYGPRLLGYNGSAYQDLNIGSMPTAGTFSIKSLANGDCNFGYNVNVTGTCTANKFYGDGSNLTNIKTVVPLGICSTASATAAKTITLNNPIVDNAHFYCKFTNANTSPTITLSVNSEGDWDIYDLKGNQITGTYFSNAANETCLFKIDKTNSRFILITAPFWESRMGMPSNVYIDLTLDASGSTYTAPADGFYFIDKNTGANATQYINFIIYDSTNTIRLYNKIFLGVSCDISNMISIKKGNIAHVSYDASGTTNYFRFIYTEGGKP